jgi:hypothetical protein
MVRAVASGLACPATAGNPEEQLSGQAKEKSGAGILATDSFMLTGGKARF